MYDLQCMMYDVLTSSVRFNGHFSAFWAGGWRLKLVLLAGAVRECGKSDVVTGVRFVVPGSEWGICDGKFRPNSFVYPDNRVVSHTGFVHGRGDERVVGLCVGEWTDDISNEEEGYLKSQIECTARRGTISNFPTFSLWREWFLDLREQSLVCFIRNQKLLNVVRH
jgi:hypothetical protein